METWALVNTMSLIGRTAGRSDTRGHRASDKSLQRSQVTPEAVVISEQRRWLGE